MEDYDKFLFTWGKFKSLLSKEQFNTRDLCSTGVCFDISSTSKRVIVTGSHKEVNTDLCLLGSTNINQLEVVTICDKHAATM